MESEDNGKESFLSYHVRPRDQGLYSQSHLASPQSFRVFSSPLYRFLLEEFSQALDYPLHFLGFDVPGSGSFSGPDIFKRDLFGYGQND